MLLVLTVVLRYTLTGIEGLTRTQVINAVKRAFVRAGQFWHTSFAAKRFTPEAFSEYGFRPRWSKYEKRKARFYPGSAGLPLVLHGDWRERVLGGSSYSRIRATRDTITIPLDAPHATQPEQADEIRRVTTDELRQVKEAMVEYIGEELDAEVPAGERNRGFIGGRVKSLSLKNFNPVARRTLAAAA
jgi:hypothetical protein